MSRTALLLCSRLRPSLDGRVEATVVDDLCHRPALAAAALRETGASRVVLGLCERRPSPELVASLRRAGAVPFGIEAVELAGRSPAEAVPLVAAARAKLEALPEGERGRPALNGGAVSRRTLFSVRGAVTEEPVAALDEAACAGTARCGLCAERCPVHAIAATSPVPTIDPGACTACGACVPSCPQGALRLAGAATVQTERRLEQLVPDVDGIVLACAAAAAEAPPGWALVELPTLALVTVGWLLQLRAHGVGVRLASCGGACCSGVAAVEELAERLASPGRPRADARGERIVLTEPRATAEAIRQLVPQGSDVVVEAEASPLGVVTLDVERCTLCGACAAACPTEALRLDEDREGAALRLEAASCVACGRCATACPERAVSIRRGVDVPRLAQGTVALASAPRERCAGCGADLPPRPLRRRLRELLPGLSGAPLDLCAGCAARSRRTGPAGREPRALDRVGSPRRPGATERPDRKGERHGSKG